MTHQKMTLRVKVKRKLARLLVYDCKLIFFPLLQINKIYLFVHSYNFQTTQLNKQNTETKISQNKTKNHIIKQKNLASIKQNF